MKLLQDCWVVLLELFNVLTLSSTGGSSLQQALKQPDFQVPLPDYESKNPVFYPPSGPEDPNSKFQCNYTAMGNQWVNCSSPTDRTCWLAGPEGQRFDINTDYESFYPNGTTRKYHLTVDEKNITADGVLMSEGKVFNDMYPGPWIQACWGDWIEITVKNKLSFNGTSVHWHGIRQLGSLEMDGVNAVTQCPIAPNDTFTYKFRATQYGTSWYHSHYALQYGDGLVGPLTIHGPSSSGYDDVRDPILVTDWNHRSGFQDFQQELQGLPPLMESFLLNGQGSYAGGKNNGYRYNTTVEKGTKYLLRLINTSVDSTFIFSIDNHNLTVISADFVPIEPYITDHVVIGIGQRYHVILTATPLLSPRDKQIPNTKAFWIRTIATTGCGGFSPGNEPDERQGILYYAPDLDYYPSTIRTNFSLACRDEPYENLVPVIPWIIGNRSNDDRNDNYEFGVNLQGPDSSQGRPLPNDSFSHWAIGDRPLWLNFSDPLINNLGKTSFDPESVVIPENYPEGSWICLLITSHPLFPLGNRKGDIPAAHPIHLHGHDFAILQQSSQNFSSELVDLKKTNPPRRDVVLLPQGGFVIIAFKADNPGVWLMHCHIAWHASSGLALQILERQNTAQQQLTPKRLQETERVCDNWNEWFSNPENRYDEGKVTFQDDSGI